MAQKILKEYEGEWTIHTPACPTEFKNIITPSFTPFPDKNISFCFEAWYQQVKLESSCLYLFKLKLVKLFSACTSSTFRVSVKVNYFDGTNFAEYYDLTLDNKRNDVTFNDVVRKGVTNGYPSAHSNRMTRNTLIIKCKMAYDDQDQTSHKMKSSKYVDLIKNLKSMYEPSILSDFIFKVGDKSFPAHKVILAAHSPVFKNMMTHEFLESKTNSVTITDSTPEIFDLFLRYLYSGELDNKTWDFLIEFYYLADKYDVGVLKIECTDAIISLLSVDLVCEILKLAYRYNDPVLKIATINFAVNHIKEIVPREDWKELVSVHPMIGYAVTVNFVPK